MTTRQQVRSVESVTQPHKSKRDRWRREHIPEGVLISSLPLKLRFGLYWRYPKHTLAYLSVRFRIACPLPGDWFAAFDRDLVCQFSGVDRGLMRLAVYPGMTIAVARSRGIAPQAEIRFVPERDFRHESWMPLKHPPRWTTLEHEPF